MKPNLKILVAMTALAVASCGTQRKAVKDDKVADTQKVAPEVSVKSAFMALSMMIPGVRLPDICRKCLAMRHSSGW